MVELREMDGLIVRHLVDIEEAGKRAYALDFEVFKVLGKTAEKWATKAAWQGSFDIDGEGFWLNPPDWKLPAKTDGDEEVWLAYFDFNVAAGDDLNGDSTTTLDFFKLTRLCQARNGRFGFRWKSDHYAEGQRVPWRNFIRDNAQDIIRETGFEHEEKEGTFFLTVTVNAETLASAIEQDAIGDALGPFETALNNLTRAEAAFTRLLKLAEPKFARPT